MKGKRIYRNLYFQVLLLRHKRKGPSLVSPLRAHKHATTIFEDDNSSINFAARASISHGRCLLGPSLLMQVTPAPTLG